MLPEAKKHRKYRVFWASEAKKKRVFTAFFHPPRVAAATTTTTTTTRTRTRTTTTTRTRTRTRTTTTTTTTTTQKKTSNFIIRVLPAGPQPQRISEDIPDRMPERLAENII